eukprot:ctg_1526.g626
MDARMVWESGSGGGEAGGWSGQVTENHRRPERETDFAPRTRHTPACRASSALMARTFAIISATTPSSTAGDETRGVRTRPERHPRSVRKENRVRQPRKRPYGREHPLARQTRDPVMRSGARRPTSASCDRPDGEPHPHVGSPLGMVDAIVPGVQKRSSLSLKQVESVLCSLPRRRFERPRIDLEQYVTSAHVAARVAACAVSRSGEVPERVVDLGTGTGMLAAAVVLHGCPVAVGVDVDVDALRLARENGQHLRRQSVHKPEHSVMDWIQADVVDGVPLSPKTFEVAVMNPPFGTRHRAVDMAFWDVACTLATDAVYTMHKSSTR